MLGLQIDAPGYGVVELVAGLDEYIHGLGIGDAAEVAGCHVLQPFQQALVHEIVEELHLLGALFQHGVDDVFYHGFHALQVALQIAEGHFGLYHPELGGMAGGVGIFSAEGGTEGVYVAEGHGEVFGVQLTGDGEIGGLAEKVLGIVYFSVLGAGRIFRIQRGDAEHFAGALAVGAGDDGGVDVNETAVLEELVHGVCGHASHAECGGKQIRAGAQMLDGAQILHAVALLLQGVVRGGRALHSDAVGLQLKGLGRVGGDCQRAVADKGGANVLLCYLVVIIQKVPVHDHLQGFEAGAVVQFNKSEIFHVADSTRPAADGDALSVVSFRRGEKLRHSGSVHKNTPNRNLIITV